MQSQNPPETTALPVEAIVNRNEVDPRQELPIGLEYCDVCGEPKGEVDDKSIGLVDDASARDHNVEVCCYCDAVKCKRCGRRTYHRPFTTLYDTHTKIFGHVPADADAERCRDCGVADFDEKLAEAQEERRRLDDLAAKGLEDAIFYCHFRDGVMGRKNPDGTFDSLMPNGTWRRNVPDMNPIICDEIPRKWVRRVAEQKANMVEFDLDASPVDLYLHENKEIVPFADGVQSS